jgi:hypothetical protein
VVLEKLILVRASRAAQGGTSSKEQSISGRKISLHQIFLAKKTAPKGGFQGSPQAPCGGLRRNEL